MKRLWIIGGDRRAIWLAHTAIRLGYNVQSSCFDDCENDIDIHHVSLENAADADVLVLPMPYQKHGNINAPLGKPVPFEKLVEHIHAGTTVIAGHADRNLAALSEQIGFNVVDIYNDETYTMENAVPSAEGAIYAAMTQSNVTLHGNRCMVIGFGRIGKILADQLKGLGAHVTVFARKPQDRALAQALGYYAVHAEDWHMPLGAQRFIFNTVPALVLDKTALGFVSKNALIIDISSAPYGVDFDAAHELGLKTSIEPALPGRYCPETAGCILFDAIARYLD